MTLAQKRVLVVEDEAIVSLMIERALDSLGCVVVATSAELEDALSKATTLAVDAAMLDINLDGKTSYPVARVLRDRKIPFLFATGYDDAVLPADLQGVLVICKPFKIRSLESALLEILARGPLPPHAAQATD